MDYLIASHPLSSLPLLLIITPEAEREIERQRDRERRLWHFGLDAQERREEK